MTTIYILSDMKYFSFGLAVSYRLLIQLPAAISENQTSFADVDDCIDVTCQNGGYCVDRNASRVCACVEGFTGMHCEIGKNCTNIWI